jgi:hypothetical protein
MRKVDEDHLWQAGPSPIVSAVHSSQFFNHRVLRDITVPGNASAKYYIRLSWKLLCRETISVTIVVLHYFCSYGKNSMHNCIKICHRSIYSPKFKTIRSEIATTVRTAQFLVLISVRGRVDPRFVVRLKGLDKFNRYRVPHFWRLYNKITQPASRSHEKLWEREVRNVGKGEPRQKECNLVDS